MDQVCRWARVLYHSRPASRTAGPISRAVVGRLKEDFALRLGLPEWWGAGLVAALLLMLFQWPDLAERYPPTSQLQRVERAGTVRAAVPLDPGIDQAAFKDLHHALLREFANRLDVTVTLVPAPSQAAMFDMLRRGEVDLAVPARPVGDALPDYLRAAPVYADSQTHLVCSSAVRRRPRELTTSTARQLRVSTSDGYVRRLTAAGERPIALAQQSPLGTVRLLQQVAAGEVPCTLAQRDEVERARQRMPNLRLGPAIGPSGGIGWLSRNTHDDSLSRQVDRFFLEARQSGLLAQLRQQEHGLRRRFDVVDLNGFRRAMEFKLPRYEADFRRAGARYGIDWRLVAALAYQESRWNPRAESSRGARGLMMLIAATARSMGAHDRFDAESSIAAGTRYLAWLHEQLGEEVAEPDRTWLTLAAYNIGPGGLERARESVREQGGNPNRWPEVRRVLPTLQPGARGWEPVFHVESVRRYFALLRTAERVDGRLALLDL